jgi:hypothetical protein
VSSMDIKRNEFPAISTNQNHEQTVERLTLILVDSIDVYMGIRGDKVSKPLIIKSIKEILSKYDSLSFQDIEYSFERFNYPEKFNQSTLTINEVLEPIKQYFHLKNKIKAEKIKMQAEINERNEQKLKSDIFYQESKKTYLKSLENKKWLGDMFQAKVLLNHFTKYFSEETRNEYKKKAKIEEVRILESGKLDAYLYSFERILANMVIIDCVKNGYRL